MPNLLINHFLAQHRPQPGGSGTPSCIPIVAVQAPPLPDERRFYQAILSKVFAPFRPSKTAGNLQFEVVQLLSAGGVENADHRRDSARVGGTNAQAAALSQCDQAGLRRSRRLEPETSQGRARGRLKAPTMADYSLAPRR
jgi:hypothetical protein